MMNKNINSTINETLIYVKIREKRHFLFAGGYCELIG